MHHNNVRKGHENIIIHFLAFSFVRFPRRDRIVSSPLQKLWPLEASLCPFSWPFTDWHKADNFAHGSLKCTWVGRLIKWENFIFQSGSHQGQFRALFFWKKHHYSALFEGRLTLCSILAIFKCIIEKNDQKLATKFTSKSKRKPEKLQKKALDFQSWTIN